MWDRTTGVVALVSEGLTAAQPSISGDGRFVAFVGHETEESPVGVYRWDRTTGTTTELTGGSGGTGPMVSADGGFVTFESSAPDIVPGDNNGVSDIFVWVAATGTTSRITDGDAASEWASISADGRWIAFHSPASNLVPGDTNGVSDVFLWDRASGTTARLTDGDRRADYARISADGQFVTFGSAATNLRSGDTDEDADVLVWEAATGEIRRITDGVGAGSPTISGDGRYITYQAWGSSIVPDDTPDVVDVYLWDRATGETRRLVSGDGHTYTPEISDDGSAIVFYSHATDIVDGEVDANGWPDVFVWTRGG